ncbi:MAG: rhodanese-like domain-containing protein, partial [Blastomonas fulva]
MSLKSISPQTASELVNQGAVLVDIRAADEHARERIATARHVSMDRLRSGGLPLDGAPAFIFHCRSGNRTRVNASVLGACTACDAYVLEGGLDAWKKAGLPVVADASQPLELQRQVTSLQQEQQQQQQSVEKQAVEQHGVGSVQSGAGARG